MGEESEATQPSSGDAVREEEVVKKMENMKVDEGKGEERAEESASKDAGEVEVAEHVGEKQVEKEEKEEKEEEVETQVKEKEKEVEEKEENEKEKEKEVGTETKEEEVKVEVADTARTRPPTGESDDEGEGESEKEGKLMKASGEKGEVSDESRASAHSSSSINTEDLREARYTPIPQKQAEGPTLNDFEFGDEIGEGAYGRVVMGKLKGSDAKYAVKIMDKKQIVREKKVKYVKAEKNILHMLDHPFIVKLACTFQDAHSLYLVLDYVSGGEMFAKLREVGSFDVEVARFYLAETICCLEYLHSMHVVHRDLKPENMLLSADMHLVVTDFGTSAWLDAEEAQDPNRKASFCGTAEYVSPEVLNDKPATYASDLWALGCILYQFLTGKVPFKAESEYLIFQKILKKDFTFPDYFPADAKDLVEKLMALDPAERLGASSFSDLKQHPFFCRHGYDERGPSLHYSPSASPLSTRAEGAGGGGSGGDGEDAALHIIITAEREGKRVDGQVGQISDTG